MNQNTKTCSHPGCACKVPDGEKFCSPYCHDAGSDEMELSCDCGHAGCKAAQPTATV